MASSLDFYDLLLISFASSKREDMAMEPQVPLALKRLVPI
jgi:BarA-like signal transduction histidine kinase